MGTTGTFHEIGFGSCFIDLSNFLWNIYDLLPELWACKKFYFEYIRVAIKTQNSLFHIPSLPRSCTVKCIYQIVVNSLLGI